MVELALPEIDYTRYSNRQLATIPLVVLGVALAIIVARYLLTGVPVDLGIEFTGGTRIRFSTAESLAQVRDTLSGFTTEPIAPLGGNGYRLETQSAEIGPLTSTLEDAGYTIQSTNGFSGSFGEAAQEQALFGLVLAFLGMAALVFVLFRTFVPSVAVVVSAFSDIMIPLALMNVLGIELSLGTVAALLMLIGYSVDSDILLNNHILRRTGVTMTLTSISAMIVMWLVASGLEIRLLPDIGLILVFGLTADLMNTYLLNMSLLRWYKYEGVAR